MSLQVNWRRAKAAGSVDGDKTETSQFRYGRQLRLLLVVAGLVVLFDQLSKLWINANRPDMELLPGFLDLVYVTNHGAAFGLLGGHTELLIALGMAGSVAILVFFHYFRPLSPLGGVSFALVLGGAVGNLMDRIRLGYVIDFISFQPLPWPPFNIADGAITVGILALIYYFYRSGAFGKRHGRRTRPEA